MNGDGCSDFVTQSSNKGGFFLILGGANLTSAGTTNFELEANIYFGHSAAGQSFYYVSALGDLDKVRNSAYYHSGKLNYFFS